MRGVLDYLITQVCKEHARWRNECDEVYTMFCYAAVDHNKIAWAVRSLAPSVQWLARQGAWDNWRGRVKDLVSVSPYHPLLFEGKRSGEGMCQLWHPICKCGSLKLYL